MMTQLKKLKKKKSIKPSSSPSKMLIFFLKCHTKRVKRNDDDVVRNKIAEVEK